MGIRSLAMVAAMAGLAGCGGYEIDPNALTADALSEQVSRAAAVTFSETPFANGMMSIVAIENGEMKTFTLVSCNNGTAICSGSYRGQAGRLTITPDHYVVEGVYGNRTFFLRPGGGGTLRRGGVDIPLVWNATVNGVSRMYVPGVYPNETVSYR